MWILHFIALSLIGGAALWVLREVVVRSLFNALCAYHSREATPGYATNASDATRIEDAIRQINGLSMESAFMLSCRLLENRELFSVIRATTDLATGVPKDLLCHMSDQTRQFFEKWELADTPHAAVGRCWLRRWTNTDFVVIGGGEDDGDYLTRGDTDQIFSHSAVAQNRADPIPLAASIYHLIAILAECYGDA